MALNDIIRGRWNPVEDVIEQTLYSIARECREKNIPLAFNDDFKQYLLRRIENGFIAAYTRFVGKIRFQGSIHGRENMANGSGFSEITNGSTILNHDRQTFASTSSQSSLNSDCSAEGHPGTSQNTSTRVQEYITAFLNAVIHNSTQNNKPASISDALKVDVWNLFELVVENIVKNLINSGQWSQSTISTSETSAATNSSCYPSTSQSTCSHSQSKSSTEVVSQSEHQDSSDSMIDSILNSDVSILAGRACENLDEGDGCGARENNHPTEATTSTAKPEEKTKQIPKQVVSESVEKQTNKRKNQSDTEKPTKKAKVNENANANAVIDRTAYKCEQCDFSCSRQAYLSTHIRDKHSFKCENCLLKFETKQEMKDHKENCKDSM